MYKTPAETTVFFEKFRPLVEKAEHCEVVICPPYTDIAAAVAAVEGTRIGIGAQDLYWAKEGAFTGEVSGPMIMACGCTHVLVGHSERRQYFEETNETVLQRTIAALDAGLTPIVCVGERLQERESGETEAVTRTNQKLGTKGLQNGEMWGISLTFTETSLGNVLDFIADWLGTLPEAQRATERRRRTRCGSCTVAASSLITYAS